MRIRKLLAGVVVLSLGASACFRSQQRSSADDAPDAAIDTPFDAAVPHDAATPDARHADPPELAAGATGMEVVLAFEQLLMRRCACDASSSCAEAWSEQFDDVSQACVADAIEHAGVSACAASGLRELIACWYGAGCRRCPSAELTEDTPLADLVEESCAGEQKRAYVEALTVTLSCTP